MNLSRAREIANELLLLMKPYCERVVIAGSVRRCKPEVKDIEIVAIPRMQAIVSQHGLFSESTEYNYVNLLKENFNPSNLEWIKPGTPDIVPWERKPTAKYWRAYICDEDIRVDIFMTYKEHNFGVIQMFRTGSKEFTSGVVMPALRERGFKFHEGNLRELDSNGELGRTCYCPDEESIFRLANLPYVSPVDRKGPINAPLNNPYKQ